jgi:hypothetical protein
MSCVQHVRLVCCSLQQFGVCSSSWFLFISEYFCSKVFLHAWTTNSFCSVEIKNSPWQQQHSCWSWELAECQEHFSHYAHPNPMSFFKVERKNKHSFMHSEWGSVLITAYIYTATPAGPSWKLLDHDQAIVRAYR